MGMKLAGAFVLVCLAFAGPLVSATPESAIKAVLESQVAAWNQGNLMQFVAPYAQHCTLVSSTISETTREQVLEHYQHKYPSTGAMGRLAFSELNVHSIEAHVAIVTGRWRLARDAHSGGPVGGVFSLVFELVGGSWQIALDHTS